MSVYSVIREAGLGFLDGGIAAQPDVADHAAFMNGLAEDGLLVTPRNRELQQQGSTLLASL